jgi:hypothetical protein
LFHRVLGRLLQLQGNRHQQQQQQQASQDTAASPHSSILLAPQLQHQQLQRCRSGATSQQQGQLGM